MRTIGRLQVDGEPQPKQRPRCVFAGKHPRAITPPATVAAEREIAEKYKEQNRGAVREAAFGLCVEMHFFSRYSAAVRPDRMPDLDNLVKLVSDALNGVAWVDDKQVDEIRATLKRGWDRPGLVVVITTEAPQQMMWVDEVAEMTAADYVRISKRLGGRKR